MVKRFKVSGTELTVSVSGYEYRAAVNDNDKKKIYFTHFNHTNPLLINGSAAQQEVKAKGFQIAEQGTVIVAESIE